MATIPQSPAEFPEISSLKRFSSADYLRMIEAGLLGPDDRVELIGGIIVNMSPQGSRHNNALMQLNRLFAPLWTSAIVAIQATATIAEGSIYDPDLMVLQARPQGYKDHHPHASDVLLIVEVADSSLKHDEQVKRPVYAQAGIGEYWIVDVNREELIIHREPDGSSYRIVETRRGDDVVSPSAAPELSIAVRQLFE